MQSNHVYNFPPKFLDKIERISIIKSFIDIILPVKLLPVKVLRSHCEGDVGFPRDVDALTLGV